MPTLIVRSNKGVNTQYSESLQGIAQYKVSAFFVRLMIIISSPAISELFLLLHAFDDGRKWSSKW